MIKKVSVALITLATVTCLAYLYVQPTIKVINKSSELIASAKIELPNGELDFGSLEVGEASKLAYSLTQHDGQYTYTFTSDSGATLYGACGYVTNSQINKEVVITINKDNVDCVAEF